MRLESASCLGWRNFEVSVDHYEHHCINKARQLVEIHDGYCDT